MKNKFDELTKGLAQSVTRRQALRRFGVGIAGVALAMLGLPDKAQANYPGCMKWCTTECKSIGLTGKACHAFCHSACHGGL